jgi:hypothetical protein
MRLLHDGEIAVSDAGYTTSVEQDDDYVDVEIEGLDERVTSLPVLTFKLDYPFETVYEGKVITDAGASLRQIIDAIRDGFRIMYRGAVSEDTALPGNKRVQGDYGQAFHVIDDLVIESIAIDDETGELDISIGS